MRFFIWILTRPSHLLIVSGGIFMSTNNGSTSNFPHFRGIFTKLMMCGEIWAPLEWSDDKFPQYGLARNIDALSFTFFSETILKCQNTFDDIQYKYRCKYQQRDCVHSHQLAQYILWILILYIIFDVLYLINYIL